MHKYMQNTYIPHYSDDCVFTENELTRTLL